MTPNLKVQSSAVRVSVPWRDYLCSHLESCLLLIFLQGQSPIPGRTVFSVTKSLICSLRRPIWVQTLRCGWSLFPPHLRSARKHNASPDYPPGALSYWVLPPRRVSFNNNVITARNYIYFFLKWRRRWWWVTHISTFILSHFFICLKTCTQSKGEYFRTHAWRLSRTEACTNIDK